MNSQARGAIVTRIGENVNFTESCEPLSELRMGQRRNVSHTAGTMKLHIGTILLKRRTDDIFAFVELRRG